MAADAFSITLHARWADMDSNAHMANSAYLDVAVEARLAYLESQGFPAGEFARLRLGPIVMEDVIRYFAEVRLRERLRVTLELAGMTADGSRFRFRNDIFRDDGKLAAQLTSHGAWFDLEKRKIVAPPSPLLDAMARLSHCADFADI